MSPLTWHVDTGPASVLVMIHGVPDRPSVSALTSVLSDLAGRATGDLLIDFADMAGGDGRSIGLALAAGCRRTSAGTSTMLRGTPAPHLTGEPAALPLRSHLARAMTAVAAAASTSLFSEPLLPVSGAALHSRDVVTTALLVLGLPGLVGTAALLASELVSQAGTRASTIMTLSALMHQETLYLCLRSGVAVRPERTPRNLDLVVVHAMADHWGMTLAAGDMVSWAALAVPGRRARR